jgi:hypothetical protein
MRLEHVDSLVSPVSGLSLHLQSVQSREHGEIKEGMLVDASGDHKVPIRNFIPRSSPMLLIRPVSESNGIAIARSR